jgi:hypothetical protein
MGGRMVATRSLDVLTIEDLRSLLTEQPTPTISIFHPTSKVVVRPQENSLRLKSLLPKVKEQLEQLNLKDCDELMQPITSLLEDRDFWVTQLEGLALFQRPNELRIYRLPFSVDEIALVSEVPYVAPLLPALFPETRFYVLALSQHAVRLLRCTRGGIERIDLEGLDIPMSLDEALRYDDLQKPDLMGHPVGPAQGPRGDRSGVTHGFPSHGEAVEGHKSQVRRFFEAVDGGISKQLSTESSPLVIAAVDYLQALYREVSRYTHILADGIHGNPDRTRDDELFESAFPIIERAQAAEIKKITERQGALMRRGLASVDLESILRAAHEGRVEVLFVARGQEEWGAYEFPNDVVRISEERRPGDIGLHDLAARQTILQAGTVLTPDRTDMPAEASIAAIYRY